MIGVAVLIQQQGNPNIRLRMRNAKSDLQTLSVAPRWLCDEPIRQELEFAFEDSAAKPRTQ